MRTGREDRRPGVLAGAGRLVRRYLWVALLVAAVVAILAVVPPR